MWSTLSGLALGVLVGMRHAFEPDHLAAVSTLVTESPGARRGAFLGAAWGVGHTVTLLAGAIAVAAIGHRLSPTTEAWFEVIVAAMILALGVRSLVRAFRSGPAGPVLVHAHLGHRHVHAGVTRHVHVGRWTLAVRPLIVGMIHGLAGSGALTVVAAAQMSSVAGRVAFVGLFGLGSVAGMATLSGVLGAPLARIARRPMVGRIIMGAAGTVALVVATLWGYLAIGELLA